MGRSGDRLLTSHGVGRRTAAVAASALVIGTLALSAAAPAPALAASVPICVSGPHPLAAARMSTRIATIAAERPHSLIGLAAFDPALGLSCAMNPTTHFHSASVVKVTILSALLLKIGGVGHLTAAQRTLAHAMITQSSNSAATALWNEVGMADMQRFLNRAGMHETVLSTAWGLTQITAHDELTLLQSLSYPSAVLGPYARDYVLTLMAEVIPSQRWGVSAGAPAGVTVHIKNGWLPYPNPADWLVNSIGAVTGAKFDYQMVVLTAPAAGGQSESYGIQTIQAVAATINANIAGLEALFGRG